MAPENRKPVANRRTVCDHCRRRRIRCDGEFPCNQCNNASLSCKRDHVPKRRGPKRGSGRVINELRAQDVEPKIEIPAIGSSHGSLNSDPTSIEQWISDSHDATPSPTISHPQWHPIMADISHSSDEPASIFTSAQFRPTSPSYLHLIPTCIDLFMEHIYPIMPLVHMPTLRESIARPLEMFEKNLLYSLCALTSTHMSGKSILAPGPPSWEATGRFFLDECISVRQSYDFVEDKSLSAVISSYFVSTAFFEINQNRKSWYYLREALTMGQDLKLHDETSYVGLPPEEALCRRRTFWILYVTERSFAILRHKPLTLSKTPAYPSTIHDYELPSIHTGFMHLVNSYHLLDSSFVDSWNEASCATTSTQTYTSLQRQLNRPHPNHLAMTDIQKADILVTQQWLRLIVWQSSMRQGLLSSNAEDESMTFRYPLKIAHSLLSVISSLPTTSIEVHGMGIFEKIFEIGNTMLDVMQACGPLEEGYGSGRDPFEMFVKTLSQTPNSQKQYANLLLQKAAEKPEILRRTAGLGNSLGELAVGAGPGAGGISTPFLNAIGPTLHLATPVPSRQWRGSIVGEFDDDGVYTGSDGVEQDLLHCVGKQTTATWSEDAMWISEGATESEHDRLVRMDSAMGTESSGEVELDIELDGDDDVDIDVDIDVDVDVDWDFAVKLEA